MNLRIKLFTAFLGLVIIPLFVLGIITFWITFNSIEKKYSQQAEYSLKAISYSIKNVFQEMNNVTDNGISKGVFQAALSAKDPDTQDLTATTQLELNANQRNFRSLLYSHPAIDYAFLYNIHGGRQSNVIAIFNKENFETLPYEKFKEHPLYNEVMALNGQPKWIAPHEYPELTGSDNVFTQIRLIKELSNLERVGVLVVQIKNWEFEKIFQNLKLGSQMRDTRFMLVNDKGLILYDYQLELDGQQIEAYLPKKLKWESGEGYRSFKGKFNNQESVISIYKLQDYPWSLVSVTSWSYLSQEVTTFAKWFVAIICVCVLTAMLFNLIFMNRITGTIGVIVRFMRKVESGDLKARVDEKGDDELLLLQKGFNNQMDKINELFEQVKREQRLKANAELRVLQAQIKPHFLFNTLESINVLAVQNEGRKVSEMVLRLANILRISIQDKEEIKLSLEIEHMRSYLEIQKFRFEELFEYSIDIPDEMMNCLLLKLTLQPLVENSIQHGFEGIDYKGRITVTGKMEQDRILLRVEDNGIGMTNEQLAKIQYADLDDPAYRSLAPYPNHERRGLGLRSVSDRLRFQYGSRYGLFICSQPGYGTTIQCVIPRYEAGDHDEIKSVAG